MKHRYPNKGNMVVVSQGTSALHAHRSSCTPGTSRSRHMKALRRESSCGNTSSSTVPARDTTCCRARIVVCRCCRHTVEAAVMSRGAHGPGAYWHIAEARPLPPVIIGGSGGGHQTWNINSPGNSQLCTPPAPSPMNRHVDSSPAAGSRWLEWRRTAGLSSPSSRYPGAGKYC